MSAAVDVPLPFLEVSCRRCVATLFLDVSCRFVATLFFPLIAVIFVHLGPFTAAARRWRVVVDDVTKHVVARVELVGVLNRSPIRASILSRVSRASYYFLYDQRTYYC